MENNAEDDRSKLRDEVRCGVMHFCIGLIFSIIVGILVLIGIISLAGEILLIGTVSAAVAFVFFYSSSAAFGRAAEIAFGKGKGEIKESDTKVKDGGSHGE